MLAKVFLIGGGAKEVNFVLLKVTEFELSLIFFFLLIRLESSIDVKYSMRTFPLK